jgi:hypothetical protein
MVQIHALEQGFTDVRVTHDIDVLGQARPQGTLMRIDDVLRNEGFVLEPPDPDGYAHRYTREGVVVDVLAPDGIKPPPRLTGSVKAIAVPGGHQALARSESVRVSVDEVSFAPDLRRTERKWLRAAEARLAFAEPADLDPATVRRARQAYRLLVDPV